MLPHRRPTFVFRCIALALAIQIVSPVLTGCNSQSVPTSTQSEASSEEPVLESMPESASQLESESEPQSSSASSDSPSQEDNTPSSESSDQPEEPPTSRTLPVDTIYQTPELPTGCEITALTMAIRHAGYPVSKTTMAKDYLPQSKKWYYEGNKKYGPDFREVFAGNPFTKAGYVCSAPAIVTSAQRYLADVDGSHRVENLTGSEPEDLYSLVLDGTPVVVWITIDMVDRYVSGGWYVDGTEEYLEWCRMDHCAVLMGVDGDNVIINDPISGIKTYPKKRFESVYEQRGKQAVILTE